MTDRVRRTIAFDFRNVPDHQKIIDDGFEWAVISARAPASSDALRGAGVKTMYWVQPFAPVNGSGNAVRLTPYEDAIWDVIESFSPTAILRDSLDVPCTMSDLPNLHIMDHSRAGFSTALADRIAADFPNADGIYFDYGNRTVQFSVTFNNPPPTSVWAGWETGYATYRNRYDTLMPSWRRVCLGNDDTQVPSPCPSMAIEGINVAQFSTYLESLTRGRNGIIFCQNVVAAHRTLTAAIALLNGADFNWRDFDVDTNLNLLDPEHFNDPHLGSALGPYLNLGDNVYFRRFKLGSVYANLGTTTFIAQGTSLAPNRGLVIRGTGGGSSRRSAMSVSVWQSSRRTKKKKY